MGHHSVKWVEKWVKPTRAPSRAASSRMGAFKASGSGVSDQWIETDWDREIEMNSKPVGVISSSSNSYGISPEIRIG